MGAIDMNQLDLFIISTETANWTTGIGENPRAALTARIKEAGEILKYGRSEENFGLCSFYCEITDRCTHDDVLEVLGEVKEKWIIEKINESWKSNIDFKKAGDIIKRCGTDLQCYKESDIEAERI